jgi:hypothetical protein
VITSAAQARRPAAAAAVWCCAALLALAGCKVFSAGRPAGGAQSPGSHSSDRPGSVTGLFQSYPTPAPCGDPGYVTVAAGTTTTRFHIERDGSQKVCLSGFPRAEAPTVVLTRPDGGREQIGTVPDGAFWDWQARAAGDGPGAGLLGEYSFQIAAQPGGVGQTTGRFEVVRPAEPHAELVAPEVPAGEPVQVLLTGFRPRSQVRLAVFGPGHGAGLQPPVFPLRADLPEVRTDEHGEAVARWQPPADSPDGNYAVWIDPAVTPSNCQESCVTVTLSRPQR